MATTPMNNIAQLFVPSTDLARFIVGPKGLKNVQKRIDDLKVGDLRNGNGFYIPPSSFTVIDKELGLIQFGPAHNSYDLIHIQPIRVLEKALGRRLPENLMAIARTDFPEDEEMSCTREEILGEELSYARSLVAIFSALQAMGATLESTGPEDHQLGLKATFESDRTRLEIFTRAARVYSHSPSHFGLWVTLQNESDRNHPNGHALLKRGLRRLIEPLTARTSPVFLRRVNPKPIHLVDRIAKSSLELKVRQDHPVPEELPDLKIDREGWFLKDL